MNRIFHNDFYLTASEVNSQCEMPLPRLVTLIIDTATAHANSIGIGFSRMMETNSSWVLSRLSIDLMKVPSVNRRYRISTWIESINRLFSDRDFELVDMENGETIGWAHSTWMAIDMDSRRPVDLTALQQLTDMINLRDFGGSRGGKLSQLHDMDISDTYTFKVSDIDVNRHVTTRRYIDLMIDLWPISQYDHNRISRFEIAFKHEARYGETATSMRAPHDGDSGVWDTEIRVGDTTCALARIYFTPR